MIRRDRKRKGPWIEGEGVPTGDAANTDGPVRTDVGALLRDRRLELGLEIRDVVGSTRIRRVHLTAIEDGQFDQLPGHTYVVGFLRNYATFLGLDPDDVVRRYRSGNGAPPEPAYNPPKPIPEGGVPTGAIVLIALIMAAAGYGGWYYLSATDRSVADLTGPLPQRLQELVAGWGGSGGASRDLAVAAVNPAATIATAPVAPGMPVENVPAAPASVAEVRLPSAAARPATPPQSPTTQSPVVVAAPTVVPAASAAVPASPPPTGPAQPLPVPRPTNGPAAAGPALSQPSATPPAVAVASRPAAAPAVPARPPAVDEDGEGEVAPVTVELIGNRTAAPGAEGALPQPAEAPAQTAAASAAPLDPNRVFGVTAGPARVVLRATADSWIQVRDGAGELIFTRVLRPGEIYRVPDRPGLRMVTGNAGGLAISVDDRNLSPIGAPGQVMRDVVLDPARLLTQPGPAPN